MNTARLVSVNKTQNIESNIRYAVESDLSKLKELKNKMNELQAEYDMIKDRLIATYFCYHEEYRTEKNLLLATYKIQERMTFNQTRFKQDHQDIYEMYTEKKTTNIFLLK